MFELKKLIATLLMPLPALLIIGVIGLLVLWFSRKTKLASGIIAFSFLGIFAVSFQPVSTSLLRPLEQEHRAFVGSSKPIDFIMVLGNGHVIDKTFPITSELSRTALMRLAEGIRIYRMYPGSKMILSGYSGGTTMSHARMLAKVALALGVSKSDILLLETAKDTWEEAHQAASVVGSKNLVLVTSASHMSRALNEFHQAGLDPIPAPTNFMATNKIKQPWVRYAPSSQFLNQTERYWHEKLGMLWQDLRNFLANVEQKKIDKNTEENADALTVAG
ncbi:envelope biogenesis factor ElyC [Photobacterium leiognathi]|uniref:envelope biogenesis factor ElyC n=1 Tax=Photobacterium leiognathi TaxID=553611 RepID=UPI002980A87C|nr:envelope biogenesis factor ElyC [Photobacterium leiognathi]